MHDFNGMNIAQYREKAPAQLRARESTGCEPGAPAAGPPNESWAMMMMAVNESSRASDFCLEKVLSTLLPPIINTI
jgi:hypothetical protein